MSDEDDKSHSSSLIRVFVKLQEYEILSIANLFIYFIMKIVAHTHTNKHK